jgi:hypothetical protein
MVKTFTIWMEDKLAQRRVTTSLLRNLGYEKDALDQQDIIMSTRKLSDIENAINALPLDDSNKEEMIAFAKNHRHEGLKALVAKIKTNDIGTQDTLSSVPAKLPPGMQPVPKPMNPQQQMMMQQQNQPPMAAGMGQVG